jgi:Phosphorylase superfamily
VSAPEMTLAATGTVDDRVALARVLLSRGITDQDLELHPASPSPEDRFTRHLAIPFPDGLAPTPQPISPTPNPGDPLPQADVAVVTWTVDEQDALADVLTPGFGRATWPRYSRNYQSEYAPRIRNGAPARLAERLGSYMPTRIGSTSVLCFKSELHLNQDGISTGPGTATLPVKDLFLQIVDEVRPKVVLTVGTAGSVFEEFGLGDVVVTRAAKFRLASEFRNEAFNGQPFHSDWTIPTAHLADAEALMAPFSQQLAEPPFDPPTKRYHYHGSLIHTDPNVPRIRLDGRDMPTFHPILTTDYFEFGTSANHLDQEGAAVEMGDAVLGMAMQELAAPPQWAVVRNMSDPQINGDIPTDGYRLNAQTQWAVGYYTSYGYYTSVCSSLATWGVIAGLGN